MPETKSVNIDSNLFSTESVNPILYPLVFPINELKGDPLEGRQTFDSEDFDQIDLNKENFNTSNLKKFYKSQLDQLITDNDGYLFNDNFKIFCDYLSNPFHYFLMKHDHEEEVLESELIEEFPELFDEIGRDNLITKSEKDLLIEKANDLGLSTKRINQLSNVGFIGYRTFRMLVDQVCEDGILTDNEYTFIKEKATQYNVPEEIASKLLKKGLAKAKILNDNSLDDDFYMYVISYFTLRFVEDSIGEKIVDIDMTAEIFNAKSIKISSINSIKNDVLNSLQDSISLFLNTNIELKDVEVFLRNLGLKMPPKETALKVYKDGLEKRSVKDLEKKYTSSAKEFKGFLYKTKLTNLDTTDLFRYNIYADEVEIKINKNHPVLLQDSTIVDSISHLIICLISTKIEYPNNTHIDHFWNLFSLYQKHFTMTNYD